MKESARAEKNIPTQLYLLIKENVLGWSGWEIFLANDGIQLRLRGKVKERAKIMGEELDAM